MSICTNNTTLSLEVAMKDWTIRNSPMPGEIRISDDNKSWRCQKWIHQSPVACIIGVWVIGVWVIPVDAMFFVMCL